MKPRAVVIGHPAATSILDGLAAASSRARPPLRAIKPAH
jgi:hypothetical protein